MPQSRQIMVQFKILSTFFVQRETVETQGGLLKLFLDGFAER